MFTSDMSDEQQKDNFTKMAKILAKAIAVTNSKVKIAERNEALSYVPSVIRPTEKPKKITDIFKNLDSFGQECFKSAEFKCLEWPVEPEGLDSSTIIDDYMFRGDLLKLLLRLLGRKSNFGLWLYGGRGTGKTSFIEQVCARIGYPFFQETGSDRTEFIDLFGYNVLVNGNTIFVEGSLIKAMQSGGIFVLNEIDAMAPSELIKLNEIVAGKSLYVPQMQKWIYPHPRFRICVTSNTNGCSDDEGIYAGTNRINEATKDRFWIRQVKYLEPELETQMLLDYAKQICEDIEPNSFDRKRRMTFNGLSEQMVKVANSLRNSDSEDGWESSIIEFSTPISFRGLQRWIEAIIFDLPYGNYNVLKAGFLSAYADSLTADEKRAACETAKTIIGEAFDSEKQV